MVRIPQDFSVVVTSSFQEYLLKFLNESSFLTYFHEDPRERLKEDDLDVILSPQRRSFGSGCQGNALPAAHVRRPTSPLENKENESLRLGGPRRIGSGRIIPARVFEREARVEKDRERERDFKDKRFRVGFFHFYKHLGLFKEFSLNYPVMMTSLVF